MSNLTEKLLTACRSAGIDLPGDADDYTIYRYSPSSYQREAGAMRWTMFRNDLKGISVASNFTATECARGKVQIIARHGSDVEILPEQ